MSKKLSIRDEMLQPAPPNKEYDKLFIPVNKKSHE